MRQYLSYPYGDCVKYVEFGQSFNSSSHEECYKNCLIFEWKIYSGSKCIPLLIDKYLNTKDFTSKIEQKFCSLNESSLFEKFRTDNKIEDNCHHLCPEDCIQIDYSVESKEDNGHVVKEPDYNLEIKLN